MSMKHLRITIAFLTSLLLFSCQEEEILTYSDFIQGNWTVDRGFHFEPGTPDFYVQYQVEITENNWQHIGIATPYPFTIIKDTLYLNEYGFIKPYHIEHLDATSFTLVFTDKSVSTEPVDTYVGTRN